MTDFSVTGAGDVLDYLIEGNAVSGAGALYIGLFTGDPGDTGTPSSEVSASGTAYARIALADKFTVSAAARTATSNADITFATATGSGFGTVSHIAILTNATAGNTTAGTVLFHTDITDVTVTAGDQAKISSGNLTITLN